MDNNLEKMLDYIKKEELYREKFRGEIEDKIVDNIHINDINIFPNWWYKIDNYEIKYKLLEKSLKENKSLDLLEEGIALEETLNNYN